MSGVGEQLGVLVPGSVSGSGSGSSDLEPPGEGWFLKDKQETRVSDLYKYDL